MKTTILNTDTDIFLIKFKFSSTNGKFIFNDINDLPELLKNNTKGIEYIKRFNNDTNTFKKVSKETILNLSSWETETNLYLKNHYYFTK